MAEMRVRPGEIVRVEAPGMAVVFLAADPLHWRFLSRATPSPALLSEGIDTGRLARVPAGSEAIVTRTAWPFVWVRVPGQVAGEWCLPHEWARPLSPRRMGPAPTDPPEASADRPGGPPCPRRRSGRRTGPDRLRSLLRGSRAR